MGEPVGRQGGGEEAVLVDRDWRCPRTATSRSSGAAGGRRACTFAVRRRRSRCRLTHDGGLAIAVAVNHIRSRRRELPVPPVDLVLADRPEDGHKGTFGRVVVVAGSKGFTGAPRLAAMGAARGGAGLVEVCVPEAIHSIVAAGCLEVMPTPLPDAGTGVLHPDAVAAVRDRLRGADALVIGPGLGRSPDTVSALGRAAGRIALSGRGRRRRAEHRGDVGVRSEARRPGDRRHPAPGGDGPPRRHRHHDSAGGSRRDRRTLRAGARCRGRAQGG